MPLKSRQFLILAFLIIDYDSKTVNFKRLHGKLGKFPGETWPGQPIEM